MTQARYLYSELSRLIDARQRCAEEMRRIHGELGVCSSMKETYELRQEWFEKHTDRIKQLVSLYLPSGSGFDTGTVIDLESSHADKLVFNTEFHHMDENGMYDGWTEHTVTVKPSLGFGMHLRISGRDRNGIKELIEETFWNSLTTDLDKEKK